MPRFNPTGDHWCAGVGGDGVALIVDGHVVDPGPGGAGDWLNDDEIACARWSSFEDFRAVAISTTGAHRELRRGVFEHVYGGGWRWATLGQGKWILDNGTETLPINSFGPDGSLATVVERVATTGLILNGVTLSTALVWDVQILSSTQAIWREADGVHAFGVPVPNLLPGASYGLRVACDGSQWWVLYLAADYNGQLVLHPFDSFDGYALTVPGAPAYRPDVAYADGRLWAIWATVESEQLGQIAGPYDVTQFQRVNLMPSTPIPTRPDKYWLAPNIASRDLLALFDHPEAFAHVGVFQLYVQHVLFDGANQGPNTSAALIAADIYRRLADWGIPLGIEIGSVKPGDCLAVANTVNLERAVATVREHGGDVACVSMDEPLTAWLDSCAKAKQTIGQTADAVAAWMKRASELGIAQVGWVEAWPHVGFAVQQQFLDLLAQRGVVPSHWHLDIDWHTAAQQGKNPAAFIKAAAALGEARGITLGLLVNSTEDPIATDHEHFDNLKTLADNLHGILPDAKRLIVQSWAFRTTDGLQDVPNNLGSNGLVSSLTDAVARFGAVEMPPIEPDQPPMENAMSMAYGSPVLGFSAGDLEPHPDNDGSYAVRKPNGAVLCVTPDGTVEERPTAGPWEKFTRTRKGNLKAERDNNRVYILALEE